ncbi:MAG TPA: hypothetical protein GXX28_03615 [Firmicutes bacterium]|nr:hypothetical protein [Bacillota bacterium]
MKPETQGEKSLEWARSLTLARIVGKKEPRPTEVTVTPEGKVRVKTRYTEEFS